MILSAVYAPVNTSTDRIISILNVEKPHNTAVFLSLTVIQNHVFSTFLYQKRITVLLDQVLS